MKYTTGINEEVLAELLAQYKAGTLSNDVWSQMSPALRKRIERQSK